MKSKYLLILAVVVIAAIFYYFSTSNKIVKVEEDVNASWSEVVNQYQRRADLVPNLVNTVKGYATHESSVLTQVTEARAQVGSIQVNMNEAPSPELLKQYQQAQDQLSSSLSRLIAVSEAYPDLKANENFLKLQDQLEGVENRITVARGRYIEEVKAFNVFIKSYPTKFIVDIKGIEPRSQFTVENEKAISTAPVVAF